MARPGTSSSARYTLCVPCTSFTLPPEEWRVKCSVSTRCKQYDALCDDVIPQRREGGIEVNKSIILTQKQIGESDVSYYAMFLG
jgi:hypothetical protein